MATSRLLFRCHVALLDRPPSVATSRLLFRCHVALLEEVGPLTSRNVAIPWRVETYFDGVEALHSLGIPEEPVRTLRWCLPERGAIVLGSTQSEADIDTSAAASMHVEVVRRRSGGGAVLVEPGDIIWLDVVIPSSDPLWESDVGRAFWWLGDVLASTLRHLQRVPATVHHGPLVSTAWSRQVCFAGLGPGEVTVSDRKAVGISSRRVRAGTLFQCAILRNFHAERIASLLALPAVQRAELTSTLGHTVTDFPELSVQKLQASLLERLSRLP